MSRLFNLLIILGMLISFSATPAYSTPQSNLTPSDSPSSAPASNPAADSSGMPGWPVPAQPIPHHEPGAPARSAAASYPTTRINAQGEIETLELQGLDALLADGTLSDPLQGNYNLVNLDKFMFSDYAVDSFALRSFGLDAADPPALEQIPGSYQNLGNYRFNDIASADLNGDYVDEQIAAWVNTADRHIQMSIGELPGTFGKATSAPAALAYADGRLELLVRGYDHALWRLPYDGDSDSWGTWSNAAGGILLSGPAVASRATNELDVFAIGTDNQVYHQHKAASWEGWTLVDGGGIFPVFARQANLPPVPAPAVVARGGSQLDLFRLGPDQTLWWCHSDDGQTWDAWQNLGGMLASAPAAVLVKDGPMQVYALGLDGAVWYRTYASVGSWAAWQRLESPVGVAWNAVPVLTSPAVGQVNLYLAGTEYRIWSNHFTGTAWGVWNSIGTGGELDAGIAAAAIPTAAYLFSQLSGGSLQYRLNESAWTTLAGLDVSHSLFDTGAVTKALPTEMPLENSYLDLTTGYFTGDGRQQVVLAYANPSDEIMVEIYDVQAGFEMHKTAALIAPIAASWPRVAAGDVDGDGVDEIGLASVLDSEDAQRKLILRVYQVSKDDSGAWSGALSEISYNEIAMDTSGGDVWEGYPFGGTLRIAAGDILAEQDSNNDEFAIYSDWRHTGEWTDIHLFLHVYDHQSPTQLSQQLYQPVFAADETYWDPDYATGAGLAIGDVNGAQSDYGVDEIVITLPTNFAGGDYPDIIRALRVYGVAQDAASLTQLGSYSIPEYSRYTFLDTLAVADLDQDLVNEIVMAGHFGYNTETTGYFLKYYEFSTLSQGAQDQWELPYTELPYAFNFAVGNFTGEGYQVGPPTYREQTAMISPEVLLNLPPMHRDIVDGEVITIDNGSIAIYTSGNTEELSTSSESKRDWSLSVGLETSVGAAGSTVTASLENTYGENFAAAATAINTVKFTSTYLAEDYDNVIYNATHYGIWEYPVLGVATDPYKPATIAVVWPLLSTTEDPASAQGRACDENFYTPSHQPYNVWSYDRIGEVLFEDYDPLREVDSKETQGGFDCEITMSTVSEAMRTDSFHNQISTGLEYSYENELDVPLVGKAWDVSFRASTDATYGIEQISTLTSTFTEDTNVKVDFPSSPSTSIYATKAYLYWAKGGYLVLDYQTAPDPNAGDWQDYDRTDPAFILPWYGFPDPLTGQFPTSGDDQPSCGLAKQLFTHDIEIEPAYTDNGATVGLHATLRNFSNVIPPGDVLVRFYLGTPAAGNQIASCSIPRLQLNRAAGPAGCSADWTVSGASGEEKIYAVIDPLNAFDEIHDGNDVINNNVGYGLLQVANADYFDPGLRNHQVYQSILYEQAPGLDYGLYLPTSNGSATIRFELVPTELGILTPIVGVPIQVLAFLGGKQDPQTEPEYTFGATPAGLMINYTDADLAGMQENALRLYRRDGSTWVEAACPGYDLICFPADNAVAVPICQTGTFILSDTAPIPFKELYLPAIAR